MSVTRLTGAMLAHLHTLESLNRRYDRSTDLYPELEAAVADLTAFVTDAENTALWNECAAGAGDDFAELAECLRDESAASAATMEKLRAREFLAGVERPTRYFDNVESSIDSEFGSFAPESGSKILMIGIGSFPMTAANVVRQTGATVFGTDIDLESIELGRRVVRALGVDDHVELDVAGSHLRPVAAEVTHVIFSSTISDKYRILNALHPLTRADVTVVMRYGNGLKSLFNYPKLNLPQELWREVAGVTRPGQVFDVVLYRKAGATDAV